MNEHLRLSPAGANLIKHFESCLRPVGGGKYTAYRDPVGVPTIGWGHTNHHGRRFQMGDVWTKAECDEEFLKDMRLFEKAVQRLITVPLTQFQFDALVSFTYNCGEGALERSGLRMKVNRRDFTGAAREFGKWVRGGGQVLPGLVRRRASESLLFQNVPDINYDGRPDTPYVPKEPIKDAEFEPPPQHVDEVAVVPEIKPLSESKTVWGGIWQAVTSGVLSVLAYLQGMPPWLIVFLVVVIALTLYLVIKGRIDVQKLLKKFRLEAEENV